MIFDGNVHYPLRFTFIATHKLAHAEKHWSYALLCNFPACTLSYTNTVYKADN